MRHRIRDAFLGLAVLGGSVAITYAVVSAYGHSGLTGGLVTWLVVAVGWGVLATLQRNYYERLSELQRRKLAGDDVDAELDLHRRRGRF